MSEPLVFNVMDEATRRDPFDVYARGRAEAELYEQRAATGKVLEQNPALLRLEELKALSQLGQNGNARIYLL